MCRMQFLLMSVALYVSMVHSWDIATSYADDLLNFYKNDILTSTIILASRNISALTFDEVHNTMLYVDKQDNNDNICGYDLTSTENKCFTTGSGRNIYGLAYDPVTEQVFFTDTNDKSINWISIKPGSDNNVNLLIKVSKGIPRDIAVDSCKGFIYWLNTRVVAPTIERARLDGTEREVFETLRTIPINATYNLEPNSLVIDQHKQRIYWMEPINKTRSVLFSRLLNIKHTPFSYIRSTYPKYTKVLSNTLTISKDSLFYIHLGVSVYSFTKIKSNETKFTNAINEYVMVEKKIVYSDRKMPISIVANYKIKDQIHDCEALRQVELAIEGPFCVHGTKIGDQPACNCTPGYTGERCDVSVCDYYCIHGNCSFNEERPECRCSAGYIGERCEVNTCLGYCLNSGVCILNEEDEPSCECAEGYAGTRCEANKNDTLTILVSHHGKSSTYSFPVNCENL